MIKKSFKQLVYQEIDVLIRLKHSERLRHIPLLAALSVGIPLLAGLFFTNLQSGLIACLAGLVILYIPASSTLANRMIILLVCSFGFMISYAVGLFFSFNPLLSAVVFGLFTVGVHWVTLYFKVKPPGSFFFIMVASMASCSPYDVQKIPEKIGLIGLGTMLACSLALIYSLLVNRQGSLKETATFSAVLRKNPYADFVEALIMGLFMFCSLFLAHILKLQNPYWIPISCAAVMQGASLYHIWQRVFHRILGTFVGLGLCWIILSISITPLNICLIIILLQYIIEMLILRHYAFAVVFLTPLTILLTEAAHPILHDPNLLIYMRFWDITLGSILGAMGGWFIHHEKIRYFALRRIRKTRVALKRL